jgi:hypothetical protein
MARAFEGLVGLYRQRSGSIWIDAFQQGVLPAGQPHEQLPLDRAGISFILSWASAMTWTNVSAMLGAQLEAGLAYHGRRLRPLTRGDVAAVGEVPFVFAGPTKWAQLTWPFREVPPDGPANCTANGQPLWPRKCHERETDLGDVAVRQPRTRRSNKINMSRAVRSYVVTGHVLADEPHERGKEAEAAQDLIGPAARAAARPTPAVLIEFARGHRLATGRASCGHRGACCGRLYAEF